MILPMTRTNRVRSRSGASSLYGPGPIRHQMRLRSACCHIDDEQPWRRRLAREINDADPVGVGQACPMPRKCGHRL
jgi:hypothetical protein